MHRSLSSAFPPEEAGEVKPRHERRCPLWRTCSAAVKPANLGRCGSLGVGGAGGGGGGGFDGTAEKDRKHQGLTAGFVNSGVCWDWKNGCGSLRFRISLQTVALTFHISSTDSTDRQTDGCTWKPLFPPTFELGSSQRQLRPREWNWAVNPRSCRGEPGSLIPAWAQEEFVFS